MALTPDEKRTFQQFRFSSGTYADFADILKSQPLLEDTLLNAANEVFESRLGRRIDSLQAAMSMLGYLPTRNFLSALLLGKGRQMSVTPPNETASVIRYALKGEVVEGLSPTLAHEHFVGGLVYDALLLCVSNPYAPTKSDSKPEFERRLNEHWEKGVKTAKFLRKLAQGLTPKLKLEREVTIDGLLYDIGKLSYRFLNESPEPSPSATPRPTKKPLTDSAWTSELEAGLLSHDLMGHLILWNFGFLEDTSWVALWHHQPFLARKLGEKPYVRTMLVWLADHFFSYQDFHQTRTISPRMLKNWYEASKPAFPQCTFETFSSTLKLD